MNQTGLNHIIDSFKSMWNIQMENNMKRGNKLEEKVKKVYGAIFKEFYPSQMQKKSQGAHQIGQYS